MPQAACDCHTHVFGPASQFPFSEHRAYTPGDASVQELLELHQQLGIARVVIVQPSPYGTDNSCTVAGLHAFNQLGHEARGVAVIDEHTSTKTLDELHAAGVRGVRLNFETGGVQDPVNAAQRLIATSAQIAHLGWHIQLYTSLAVVASLEQAILKLPVPVVLDHFAGAQASLGIDHPHFAILLKLVQNGKAWVKLSAPHRISNQPEYEDAAPLAQALIAANPNRMLWGSDWPHPGPKPGTQRRIDKIEAFNPIDDGAALNRLNEWVRSSDLMKKILVKNAADLYQF